MQHACRTTVLGLSRFKCAANFDVIFFPSHCLKPLALFIIRALWSEQHGNNVSRRHTPSDGPLTALRHLFLSFFPLSPPFLPCPSVCRLNPHTSSILLSVHPLFLPLNCLPPFPSSFKFTPTLYFIFYFLSLFAVWRILPSSPTLIVFFPHMSGL